jgi:hypothetical protein
MQTRHSLHQAQAQSCSRFGAALLQAHEAPQNALAIGYGNARPTVADTDL